MPLNDESINIKKIRSTFENFQYGKDHPVLSPGKNLAATIRKSHDPRFYIILSRLDRLLSLGGQTVDLQIDDNSTSDDLVSELHRIYMRVLQCPFNKLQEEDANVQSQKAAEYLRAIRKLRYSLSQFAFLHNLNFQAIVANEETDIEDLQAIQDKALTVKAIKSIRQDQARGQLAEVVRLGYAMPEEKPDEPTDTEIPSRKNLLKFLKKWQKKIVATEITDDEEAKVKKTNAQYRRRIAWSWVDEENKKTFQIAKLKKAKKHLEKFYKEHHLPANFAILDDKIKSLETDTLLSTTAETYKQYRWAHNRYWFQHYPKDFITWLRRRSGDTTAYNLFTHLGKLVNLDNHGVAFDPNQASRKALVEELNRVYCLALNAANDDIAQITEQNSKISKLNKGYTRLVRKIKGVAYSEQAAISSIIDNHKAKKAANALREIKKLRRYYCDFAMANGLNLHELLRGSGNSIIELEAIIQQEAAIKELKRIKHQQKVAKAEVAVQQALGKGKQEYKNILIRKIYGKYKISDGWLRSLADQGFILPDLGSEDSLSSKEGLEAYFRTLQDGISTQDLSAEDRKNIARRNFWLRPLIKVGLTSELSDKHYHIKKLRKAKEHLQKFYYSHKLAENFTDSIDEKVKALRAVETSDYNDEYQTIKQFIEDFKKKPWRTAWRHKLIPDRWNKKHNKQFYLIMKQLSNMRLSEHCMHLMNAFMATDKAQGQPKDGLDARARLQAFLDLLYATFNALSIQEEIRLEDLKQLKKLINTFAEQNDFEKKLFNLQKAYRKKIEDDEVAAKMSLAPHRVYGYLQNATNQVDGKKVKTREHKKRLGGVSLAVTVIVAIGEGIMAAVFFAPLVLALGPWAIPIIVLVGVCGFDVNYFLFKKDSFEALKQLFITGLFKDAKGCEISTKKKILIHASIFSSLAIALVFGSFTFNTAVIAITALLGLASIACPPLVIALAAFLAVVAVIANATMFYCMMADFVKNDRILQMASYFKRTFWDIWKQPQEWASANPHAVTTGMKVKHYLGVVATIGLNIAFLGVGVVVCAFMTMITLGLGHTQAVEVLGKIANFAPQAKDLIANIVVSAFAAPLNSYFYWRGMMRTLGTVKDGIISFASKCFNPIKSLFQFRREVQELKTNPLRTVDVVSNTTLSTLHCTAAVFNAAGQGGGPYHDHNSIANVQKIFDTVEDILKQMGINIVPHLNRLSEAYANVLAGAIAGLGSFGVNTLAIIRALQLPENSFFIKLAPEVQLMLLQGKLTFDQTKVLSQIPDHGVQVTLAQKAVDGILSMQEMMSFIPREMTVQTVNIASAVPSPQEPRSGEEKPLLLDQDDRMNLEESQQVQRSKHHDNGILDMPMPGQFNKMEAEDIIQNNVMTGSVGSPEEDRKNNVDHSDIAILEVDVPHQVKVIAPIVKKQRVCTFFATVAKEDAQVQDMKGSAADIFSL